MSAQAIQARKIKRVAVIGAGPAGLATLRELLALGQHAVCFERQPHIGGVYASHYKELQLTTSNINTAFGSFSSGGEGMPRMWRSYEYLNYLNDYADHFGFRSRIRLCTNVDCVSWNEERGTWIIKVSPTRALNRESLQSQSNLRGDFEFDHVAVCSGVNTTPVKPNIPGSDEFAGSILHSSEVSDASTFRGRRVVVMGLGESGSDMALLAAQMADACAISTRKGPGYIIPRYFAGRPTDLDTNRCYHAIPRWLASHPLVRFKVSLENCYLGAQDDRAVLRKAFEFNKLRGLSPFQRFGTKNTSFVEAILYHGAAYKPDIAYLEKGRAVFVDGSHFNCDLVVCCTGYRPEFSFLSDIELAKAAAAPRRLFKHMIAPEVKTRIAWIGLVRPGIGSIPPAAELQARYFALLVAGRRELPTASDMRADIAREGALDFEQYPEDAARVNALTDYLRFLEGVATLIGCRPPLARLFFTETRLWAKVMFGPISGAQYRLVGPGAEAELARQILRRVPTMPWPVLAWEAFFLLAAKLLYSLGAGERYKPIGV